MTDEQDIYRAANLVIDQHGHGAADYVLKRCEQLFDATDPAGAATWRLILNTIVELQRPRQDDKALN